MSVVPHVPVTYISSFIIIVGNRWIRIPFTREKKILGSHLHVVIEGKLFKVRRLTGLRFNF